MKLNNGIQSLGSKPFRRMEDTERTCKTAVHFIVNFVSRFICINWLALSAVWIVAAILGQRYLMSQHWCHPTSDRLWITTISTVNSTNAWYCQLGSQWSPASMCWTPFNERPVRTSSGAQRFCSSKKLYQIVVTFCARNCKTKHIFACKGVESFWVL